MNRSNKRDLATAIMAMCLANALVGGWLRRDYFVSRPTSPRPDLGLIHAISKKGSSGNDGITVFISDFDSTCGSLLHFAFLAALCATALTVPKTLIAPHPRAPRWISRVSISFSVEWSSPWSRFAIIFCSSLFLYIALLFLVGPHIVEYLVAHGMTIRSS